MDVTISLLTITQHVHKCILKGGTFEIILVIFSSVREWAVFYKSCDLIGSMSRHQSPIRPNSQLRAGSIKCFFFNILKKPSVIYTYFPKRNSETCNEKYLGLTIPLINVTFIHLISEFSKTICSLQNVERSVEVTFKFTYASSKQAP